LRFPEFLGEWEEKALGECTESLDYGMNASAVEYDGQNRYIRITDIDESSSKYKSENPVSPKGELLDKYLVQENDILFTRTGASTGKTYIYNKGDGKLYFAGFLIRARIKSEFNAFFIFAQTQTARYDKWVKLTSMRSGQPGINSQEYASYKLYLPEKYEQIKIAELLFLLDERIATQNKIIEDLKLLKSTISKQILHNSNWTKYKIEEIGKLGRGRVISTTEIKSQQNPKYPVFSSQTSNDGIMGHLDTYDFEGEYLTWTTDGANAGTVFYRQGKFNCTNVCGTIKIDNLHNPYFVAHCLQLETKKYVSTDLANPKLMNNTMASIEVRLPDIETQNSISCLLSSIDMKYKLENEIAIKYMKTKKYLLFNLFV
jgi:type I restriction enzyme S subunit